MVNMAGEEDRRRALQRFQEALEDLTFNSKPLIDDLTRAADTNKAQAPRIVEIIESRLMQVDRASWGESAVKIIILNSVCICCYCVV